jgi:hypothetical protein
MSDYTEKMYPHHTGGCIFCKWDVFCDMLRITASLLTQADLGLWIWSYIEVPSFDQTHPKRTYDEYVLFLTYVNKWHFGGCGG